MFSNNFISKFAYVVGWAMAIMGFIVFAGGLLALFASFITWEDDLFGLGWSGFWLGVIVLIVGLILLLIQQVLEYLIVVEHHLKEWHRKEERLEREERHRDAGM